MFVAIVYQNFKAMLLCFELKVTKHPKDDGHWKGEGKRYMQTKDVNPITGENILAGLEERVFPHVDVEKKGWEYEIVVKHINAKDKKKMREIRQYIRNRLLGQEYVVNNIIEYQQTEKPK